MASINRVGSPMDLCEENYDLNQDVLDNKRKFLENKQRNRSRILLLKDIYWLFTMHPKVTFWETVAKHAFAKFKIMFV